VHRTSTVCRDDRHHDVEVGPRERRGDCSAWETAADGPASDRSPGRVGKRTVKHTTFTIGEIIEEISNPNTGARCKGIFTVGVLSQRRPPSSGSPRPYSFAGHGRLGLASARSGGGGRVDQSAGLRSPVAFMNVHRRSEEKRAIPPRSTSTGAATSLSAGKIVTRLRLRREWRYWRCVTRSRPRRFRNGS
jgi:hypothetical protein